MISGAEKSGILVRLLDFLYSLRSVRIVSIFQILSVNYSRVRNVLTLIDHESELDYDIFLFLAWHDTCVRWYLVRYYHRIDLRPEIIIYPFKMLSRWCSDPQLEQFSILFGTVNRSARFNMIAHQGTRSHVPITK